MFIFLCLVCPRRVDPSQFRSEKGEESSGRKASCPDPGFQTTPSVEKISPARQDNLPQARVTDSSFRNALSFSSACTIKRFPSSRCASAIQIVRPSESMAETQPKLHPALLSLSAMISQDFTRADSAAFALDKTMIFSRCVSQNSHLN